VGARIKAEEKALRGGKTGDEGSLCSTMCRSPLPALTSAMKLQSRAVKVRFDWPSLYTQHRSRRVVSSGIRPLALSAGQGPEK